MHIHIVAGGPSNMIPDLTKYHNEDVYWIGVDRGLLYLLEQGIKPIKGIGDFDSVTETEMEWMNTTYKEFMLSPAEKDETDLELALNWAIEQKPSKIIVFGATGGRLDHALSNIQLLLKGSHHKLEIEIIDIQNSVKLVEPGFHLLTKNNGYKYVSFLPFSHEVKGITITGVKYPLTNVDIKWGTTLCVSNEIIEESGTFSFKQGIVIMVKSKDLME
ncbi:thiamine diphosphokinase [Bacillus suaedaesalsae]|uniref:Thiamine diphosphokinase n=1 Tax=Bacillus suaedaesalsae TaxID=2810349 RepID=A0ABS2DJ24_9BACI|nr:thiamine diphosphokinase [Bacillus suaedaesalsae]MBM6618490.1 thiamine diphosphokinase [Bacillus suaedaesalsae]